MPNKHKIKEIIKKLKNAYKEMELITEISKKYGVEEVGKTLLQKKIEDGIITKLHTANLHQLEMMKDSYIFKYYDKKVINKIIKKTIIQVTRKNKLERIGI